MAPDPRDFELRQRALEHIRVLSQRYNDVVPSVVHIATRLLEEIDGPMLRVGLQGFHGNAITQPRDRRDRPDPDRLRTRFERFTAVA